MSHVQIPPPDAQKALLSSQGQQIDGDKLSDHSDENPGSKSIELGMEAAQAAHLHDQPPRSSETNVTSDQQGSVTKRSPPRVVSAAILRDSIEAQFGLEILLKHKELRLIDQEFAKCQVAMEQLRRCQIIPYPAISSTYEDLRAASTGSGAAFDNRAPYASPWGVTHGPYTRHYQRWLIPDASFDDTVPQEQLPLPRGKTLPDRATRGSKSEAGSLAGVSRSQRGSNSARLKALPHGYPEPKEEKGPMIVKRSSDGKMVKLVCLDCRRSNFNSAQGFINHCRIAHSRQFLSHDAAIEASGEELDAEAEGGLGEVNGSAQATASAGLVHPLIRSAYSVRNHGTPSESATSSRRKKSQATAAAPVQVSTPHTPSQVMSIPHHVGPIAPSSVSKPAVPFNPSPQTPHLSALLARMGSAVDLDEAVTAATTRPDVDLTLSDDEGPEELDDVTEQPEVPQSRSTRGVLRGGEYPIRSRSTSPSEMSPTVSGLSKPVLQRPPHLSSIARHVPYASPHPTNHEQPGDHDISMLDQQSPFNLSPNTIESHTAPSLVSDDGDYDNTHSESESPSDAEGADDDDHYIHAEVMDQDDMDLGGGSSDHHLGLGGKPHSPTARRRSSAMRPPTAIHNEERHVSFASPQRRQRRDSKAKH
ncbi:ADA HAT complex component 1, partial [Lecanoromycetidae sp. Uapishka_2]